MEEVLARSMLFLIVDSGWLIGLFVGLLVCWFVCWFVGLLVCWFVGFGGNLTFVSRVVYPLSIENCRNFAVEISYWNCSRYLFVVCCLLFVVCCLLFVVCCSLFVVCCFCVES